MIYLKSFELKKEFRGIKPFKCKFIDGINVIVGENGCGKSSMLKLLTDSTLAKKLIKIDYKEGATFKFFDTEKDNPRMKSLQLQEQCYSFALASHFSSHGEAILPLIQAAKDFKDSIIIIDEPEAGLSLKNQFRILTILEKVYKENNCQILISTHSYVIINNVKVVFDLENKKWILSKDYLDEKLEQSESFGIL
jgi:predicted ATPase